jgi:putative sterol carrier protein
MNFEEIYNRLKSIFESNDYSNFGSGLYSYEFDITGDGEGKFYIEIRDGHIEIQPYDYRNSSCVFIVNSKYINQLLKKQLAPTAAYSTGRLKIKGDVSAAFRLADSLGLSI